MTISTYYVARGYVSAGKIKDDDIAIIKKDELATYLEKTKQMIEQKLEKNIADRSKSTTVRSNAEIAMWAIVNGFWIGQLEEKTKLLEAIT